MSFKRRKINMTDAKHIFGYILRSMIYGFFRSIIVSVLFLVIHNLSRFLRTHQIVNEFSYLIYTIPSSCLVDTLHPPEGLIPALLLFSAFGIHILYTVPLKCKLPPSRATRIASRATGIASRATGIA